jgi:hypothetical protein
MRAFSSLVALAVVVATAAPRPAAADWPPSGRGICTAAATQQHPAITTDGAAGAIVTWQDFRFPRVNVFAEHVLASGVLDAGWPLNGRALLTDPVAMETAAGGQTAPAIVSDGAGGAIVAWQDLRTEANDIDLFAQHILASGAVDPAWPANGAALVQTVGNQQTFVLVADGAGGAFVAWVDGRAGIAATDIFAQHVLVSGVVDPRWPVNGLAVCAAAGAQAFPAIAADGAGGAIVTWQDPRSAATGFDVYAARILDSGANAPGWPVDGRVVCGATGDQGRPTIAPDGAHGAIVAWSDSRVVATSHIFAQHVLGSGTVDPVWPVDGRGVSGSGTIESRPLAVADGAGGAIVNWQGLNVHLNMYAQHVLNTGVVDPAWAPGGQLLNDGLHDATFADIVGDGEGGAVVVWDESGHVLAQRVLFTGDIDPAYPAAGRPLVDLPTNQGDPALVATGSGGAIAAWGDARGVDGDIFAMQVLLATPADVPPPGPGMESIAFALPGPVPARAPLTLHFTLPRAAEVRLAIYDVTGRLVRGLAAGIEPAGEHNVPWDLRDRNGTPVTAGLYFVRLEAGGQALTRRVATLE